MAGVAVSHTAAVCGKAAGSLGALCLPCTEVKQIDEAAPRILSEPLHSCSGDRKIASQNRTASLMKTQG